MNTRARDVGLPASSPPVRATADEVWAIGPRSNSVRTKFREVWTYRRLFTFFARRSIERKYQGTVLGIAWLFIRPLAPIVVQVMIFKGVLGIDSPGVPYFLFVLVGSSIWGIFSGGLMWATRSLQMNRGFLSNMYFPRIIVPASAMAIEIVNFLIMMGVVAVALVYYFVNDGRIYLGHPLQMPWAVAAFALSLLLALGVGLWTAPLNAQYRDVRFTLQFIMQFWALLTPILYPLSRVPAKYHWAVYLNPMAGIVQAFKWGFLGVEEINRTVFALDAVLVFLVLASGLWYFNRVEGDAVDRM